MRRHTSRRRFLHEVGRVAIGSGVAVAVTGRGPTPKADTQPVVVHLHWKASSAGWPPRPGTDRARVVFVSVEDAAAPRPADFDLEAGDVWWRHPTAGATQPAVWPAEPVRSPSGGAPAGELDREVGPTWL